MPTLGEELKRRREERGISLNDISESTRIGTRFLKAIESDNFSILPGGIFTRSFIRAYAKEVGMNEDEAIGLYQQQSGVAPAQSAPTTQATQPQPTEIRAYRPAPAEVRPRRTESITYRPSSPPMSWPTIIIAGGIVLFIAIIVFALVKQLNKGSESPEQTASQPAQQAPPAAGQPQPQPAQQAEPPVLVAGELLVVKLEAINGESWLGYETDGSKGKPIHLKQGETTEISAKEKVKLTLGNRQALKMVINNRDAAFPDSLPKTVAKIEISRDNLQTFFQ